MTRKIEKGEEKAEENIHDTRLETGMESGRLIQLNFQKFMDPANPY